MKKEQLREGLKQLDAYVRQMDFPSVFLEEGDEVPMDSLVIPLKIGEELSIDISCNFVEVPEIGDMLQFYGQLVLTEVLKDASPSITDEKILSLLNALNRMIPVGQFLYLEGNQEKMIGIRYTMLTGLDSEAEWNKCVKILLLLMQIYELLCSSLLLFLDEKSVEEVLQTLRELMEQE